MPPEKCAFALARYSRSPDSIHQSLEWVRSHDSRKFLESFYFQYGHASIADLGHPVLCLEGISELAATEIEDEPLWDGQARSSRYQDFARSGFVTPPELEPGDGNRYRAAGAALLEAYTRTHARVAAHLCEKLPKPESMAEDAYRRNIAARAFDVARYLLFLGVPTGVGQVASIRTLEKQIRRLKASEYQELREIGGEMAAACAAPPACALEENAPREAVAPTLAKYVDADAYTPALRQDLALWARQNLPAPASLDLPGVDLVRPADTAADIVATLLYPVTDRPFRELYDLAAAWPAARRNEVLNLALASRGKRDDLPRQFRGGPYVFDIVMDIGAYRDLHRHRRCHQYRQSYTARLGFETPPAVAGAGLAAEYRAAIEQAHAAAAALPAPASHYLLPFATRSRFLFKMDFAEVEYMARIRTGVKGHFSYRQVAWEMKRRVEEQEPDLGRLLQATPPWVEDPLVR
ncbi:MAG: FAD-dependent thymidylate synthase [Acidobacteria bacterium]|nr:FAD-dependent thymidylate synthase [Acidobacteriota bacterium]